jgi:hypothetical protein
MNGENSILWYNSMMKKIKYISKNKVWDLVKLLEGSKVVGCKWVYKTKRNASDNIE